MLPSVLYTITLNSPLLALAAEHGYRHATVAGHKVNIQRFNTVGAMCTCQGKWSSGTRSSNSCTVACHRSRLQRARQHRSHSEELTPSHHG